jgi:hypothetical protein
MKILDDLNSASKYRVDSIFHRVMKKLLENAMNLKEYFDIFSNNRLGITKILVRE